MSCSHHHRHHHGKCSSNHHCEPCFIPIPGPTGGRGITGATGATGATGSTGSTGPDELLINRTVFNDIFYGNDASGVKDDEAKPYQTLAAALAVAVSGDTIYVQPGVYNEDNLVLKDGVDWYFTEGSSIVSTGNPIFIDSGGAVTSTISGYGVFSSANGILSLSNGSTINFSGISVDTSGTDAFSLTGATLNTLNVNLTTINSSSEDIFFLDGSTLLTVNVDTITAT